MILRKAFQFKLKPNGANIKAFARFCGCTRFVYNQGIEWNNEQGKLNSDFRFSYVALANLLPQWKQEWPWLAQCHSQVLQQALKDLERAFINFFEGRANFPKFHKKFKSKDSFRYPQGFKIDEGNRVIYLPKIGQAVLKSDLMRASSIRSLFRTVLSAPLSTRSKILLKSLPNYSEGSNAKPNFQRTGRKFRQRLPGSGKGLPIYDVIISAKSPVMSARTTQSSTARI